MDWMNSEIVIRDIDGLLRAIKAHENDRDTWSLVDSGKGYYLYGNGDNFGSIAALSDFAPFIESGFVLGSDNSCNPVRYAFVNGTIKKQVPQWVDA